MEHYIAFWTNFANFTGRTSRRGYWMAFLFNVLISFAVGLVVGFLPDLYFLVSLYSLAGLVPGIAICIRRLRDAGFHWGWYFIAFVPLVGAIALIVMLCQPSKNPYDAFRDAKNDPGYGIPASAPGYTPTIAMPESRAIAIYCKNSIHAGKTFRSDGKTILIGRNQASCEICFPEGTGGVSWEHCKIYTSGGSWYVQDMNSTYGTYAGGKRLELGTSYPLRSGENIFIGSQQIWLTVQ